MLPNVISENQLAFVANRSITDNVLIALEVIHHMKRKNPGSEGEVALKLDFSTTGLVGFYIGSTGSYNASYGLLYKMDPLDDALCENYLLQFLDD